MLLISLKASSQYFIPIIIPYNIQTFKCNPTNAEARDHYYSGTYHYTDNLTLAMAHFHEAIKYDSLFCDAYFYLIKAYTKLQNYDKAMELNNIVLKNDGMQPWFLIQKGILHLLKHEYKAASDHYYGLIEIQPNNGDWYYYFAESLIKQNLLDSAKKYTMKMEYILNQNGHWDPHIASFYLQGKIMYYKQEYNKAYSALNDIKKNYRRNADFCYHYGLVLFKLDEKKKALRYIKKAERLGYPELDQSIYSNLKHD